MHFRQRESSTTCAAAGPSTPSAIALRLQKSFLTKTLATSPILPHNHRMKRLLPFSALLLLAACATAPPGIEGTRGFF